jgi:hypothetical protein
MALQLPNDALFGMGIQVGDGATEYLKMAAGYEIAVSDDDDFSYYAVTDLSLGPVKNMDNLPDEIGGVALPAGAFTTGAWAEGPVSLIPRLDNRFGWLLLAAMGEVSTIADTLIANLPLLADSVGGDTGIHSHLFQFNVDNQYFIPWLTMRRLLPHATTASRVGETFQDGHVRTMTMNIAAGAAVGVDLDILARLKQSDYVFDYNPSWAAATFDDIDNFAVTTCDGWFEVEGTAFPVTNVALTVTNQLLAPAQSLVVGDFNPEDFPNLGRTAVVTATFLVEDWDLYTSIFRGAANTTDANVACPVYNADLDVMVASQTYISGNEPYRCRILSNQSSDNVAWSVRPVRFAPNQPIRAQVTGTIQATAAGQYPLYVILQNDQANYTLPAWD